MIRNKLFDLRHAHKMNQTEFAKLLEIPFNQYNRYEHQHNQPTLENCFKICHKLNIKIEDLIEYIPDE